MAPNVQIYFPDDPDPSSSLRLHYVYKVSIVMDNERDTVFSDQSVLAAIFRFT
jgi:hypothetical protein